MNAILHDFTKPTRLPTDWQNRLTSWFRSAVALANKSWAKELPVPLEVSVLALDVCFAHQALSRLTEAFLAYRVKVAGERVPTLFTLPRPLLLNLVGALVGEKTADAADRELTPVEENLMEYFLAKYWLTLFRETWPGSNPVSWVLEPREANPQCSKVFSPADVLVSLNWQIKGPWGESAGTWLFQKKGLLEELGGADTLTPAPIPEAQVSARRQAIISALPIAIEVVLGTAELKLSQLSRLQVGDVVVLDQRCDEGATAKAGDRNLFRGQVGRVGSCKALRIESAVER